MHEKRKLAFVTPQYGRGTGGLGVSAERIVNHLRDHYDVMIFMPSRSLPCGSCEVADADGLPLIRFSSAGTQKSALQYLADLLERAVHEEQVDAFFGFYISEWAYATALSARRFQKKLLLFSRGNDIDLEVFGENSFAIHFALQMADRVFCVTSELQEKIRAFCPEASTCFIPNGVDESCFQLLPAKSPANRLPVVGIFGDLKEKKGFDFLVSELDFSRFELHIVGNLREECAAFLHGFTSLYPEIIPRIRHFPFVKDVQELMERYAGIDIVCIPSYHEGMSNVMLEAMSIGRICVCSSVGGAKDVIVDGRNGFLFAPRDRDSFHQAMERAALAFESNDGALAAAARESIVQGFTRSRERSSYLEVFRELIPAAQVRSSYRETSLSP